MLYIPVVHTHLHLVITLIHKKVFKINIGEFSVCLLDEGTGTITVKMNSELIT